MKRTSVTDLLSAHRAGEPGSFERVVELLYDDLRQIAGRNVRGRSRSLNPTALVHEAWLKIADGAGAGCNDRTHFLSLAALAMRQIVVDDARRRTAQKRGGEEIDLELDEWTPAHLEDPAWVLDVHRALEKLAVHHGRLARLVECRFFGGFSDAETAEALGVSKRTVERDWPRARAWLKELLRADEERSGAA